MNGSNTRCNTLVSPALKNTISWTTTEDQFLLLCYLHVIDILVLSYMSCLTLWDWGMKSWCWLTRVWDNVHAMFMDDWGSIACRELPERLPSCTSPGCWWFYSPLGSCIMREKWKKKMWVDVKFLVVFFQSNIAARWTNSTFIDQGYFVFSDWQNG